MTKQLGALIAAFALVLTASACAADPGTTKTPTPVASDTQSADLAAAIDAFTVFNAAFDGYSGGSKSLDDLAPYVTPEYLTVLKDEEASQHDSTLTVGPTSFRDEKLVNADEWGGHGDIALVVCRDIHGTSVIEADGSPSTSTPLRSLIPMIIYFVKSSEPQHALLISKVDQWNEVGYCSSSSSPSSVP